MCLCVCGACDQDVGIIRVNSEEARELLRPCPSRCLDTLARLLPRVAGYCNATLLTELNEALRVSGLVVPHPLGCVCERARRCVRLCVGG
jgi:hypothetical protein